jgi:hypothetical protein
MINQMRLIDASELSERKFTEPVGSVYAHGWKDAITAVMENAPTVDAVEVVHGEWERCGGDLHSSGYAVCCSVCNKTHFVHYEYSLGGLYGHKEMFQLPNYCPNCGAKMDGGNEDG